MAKPFQINRKPANGRVLQRKSALSRCCAGNGLQRQLRRKKLAAARQLAALSHVLGPEAPAGKPDLSSAQILDRLEQKAMAGEAQGDVMGPMPTPRHAAAQLPAGAPGKLGFQAKFEVSAPNDRHELAADRAAAAVMRTTDAQLNESDQINSQGVQLDRSQASGAELLQRVSADRHPGVQYLAGDESRLRQGGTALPQHLREFYERRFGRDFSAVRLHTGSLAHEICQRYRALAFTFGSHVWLGAKVPVQPSFTLAHELAHVVQQTQPPHKENRNIPAGLSTTAKPSMQRTWHGEADLKELYFAPKNYDGASTHNTVLAEFRKINPNLFTEAAIPNKGGNSGKYGYADMYSGADAQGSNRTIGLYFDGNNPKYLPNSGIHSVKIAADKNYQQNKDAAPLFIPKKGFSNLGFAPQKVKIGDLKPGGLPVKEGKDQLEDYETGIKFAKNKYNDFMVAFKKYSLVKRPEAYETIIKQRRKRNKNKKVTLISYKNYTLSKNNYIKLSQSGFPKWKNLSVSYLSSLKIPAQYKWSNKSQNTASSAQVYLKQGRKFLISPSKWQKDGLPVLKSQIFVYKSKSVSGIYGYRWVPKINKSFNPFFQKAIAKKHADHQKILQAQMAELKKGPKLLRRVDSRLLRRNLMLPGHPKPRLQRKKASDPFKSNYPKWVKKHKALKAKVFAKGFAKRSNFYTKLVKAMVKIQGDVPFSLAIPKKTKQRARSLSKMRFWARAGLAFARFRKAFGKLSVSFWNAFDQAKTRLAQLKKPASGGGRGVGAAVIKLIVKILKVVAGLVLGKTIGKLSSDLRAGIRAKLEAVLEDGKFAELRAKYAELQAMQKRLETAAGAGVQKVLDLTVGPYLKKMEQFSAIAKKFSIISRVISMVRWGVRIIACLSPPGWGCLMMLMGSAFESLIAKLIETRWFQNKIAPLVQRTKFLRDFPADLAAHIKSGLQALLPEGLRDLFGGKTQAQREKFTTSGSDGRNGLTPVRRGMFQLQENLGEAGYQRLAKRIAKAGIPANKPLTVNDLTQLQALAKGPGINSPQMDQFLKKAAQAGHKHNQNLRPPSHTELRQNTREHRTLLLRLEGIKLQQPAIIRMGITPSGRRWLQFHASPGSRTKSLIKERLAPGERQFAISAVLVEPPMLDVVNPIKGAVKVTLWVDLAKDRYQLMVEDGSLPNKTAGDLELGQIASDTLPWLTFQVELIPGKAEKSK